MVKIPRIALFIPEERERVAVLALFTQHEYAVRQVGSAAEARALSLEEAAAFDVLVIPLQLANGAHGVLACMESRADEMLSGTPVLMLAGLADLAVLKACYDAGADLTVSAPYDAQALYLQIAALARLKRRLDAELSKGFTTTALYHPVVEAFESVREGLLLFDPAFQLIFMNSAAKNLFDAPAALTEEHTAAIGEQFKARLKEHLMLSRGRPPEAPQHPTLFEFTVVRLDQQQFRASCSVTAIEREGRTLVGFSAALTDLSEIRHLSNTLLQAQRTRSLCLVTAAVAMRFLAEQAREAPRTPLHALESYLNQAARACPLYATITSLMEMIDLVVNPEINIRVTVDKDLNLAVRASDFYQIVGHMLLHAVEHAGHSGQVTLHTTAHIPGEGVILTITAESRRVTPPLAGDDISKLIHGDFSGLVSVQDVSQKLGLGLAAAQKIAERYRTRVEYQQPSTTIMKIRVKLPVSRPTEGR